MADGTIDGGMIPKVEACFEALAGVGKVHVIDGRDDTLLLRNLHRIGVNELSLALMTSASNRHIRPTSSRTTRASVCLTRGEGNNVWDARETNSSTSFPAGAAGCSVIARHGS